MLYMRELCCTGESYIVHESCVKQQRAVLYMRELFYTGESCVVHGISALYRRELYCNGESYIVQERPDHIQ